MEGTLTEFELYLIYKMPPLFAKKLSNLPC